MNKNKKTKKPKNEKTETKNITEVILNGVVEETLANAMFRVRLENDIMVLCTISGKIRKNNIRILLGDSVEIGLSIYDNTKGRILYRR